LKHFILNSEPDRDGTIRLEGDDYRYLVRVRRLAVGEFFPAVLPNGTEALVQVVSVDHGVLTGKCTKGNALSTADAHLPPIILFQSLPKGEKMDLIVRQAAEGGITEIVPFISEFSVMKIKTGGPDHLQANGQVKGKFSRWERIIKEARQQSGSAITTAVHQPLTMDELLNYWGKFKKNGAIGLLFHHQALEKRSLHSYLENIPQFVVLAVGPEGGFSDNEVSRFRESGFMPLTIGDTILRTETAALYCAAAIRILLLERNSWQLKQVKTGSV
jgi:16S rRNA (uracil1498-N3)-methyltransferase